MKRDERKNELKSITVPSWFLKLKYSDNESNSLKKTVNLGFGSVSYTSANTTVEAAFHSKQGLQIWTQCFRIYHNKSTFLFLAQNPLDGEVHLLTFYLGLGHTRVRIWRRDFGCLSPIHNSVSYFLYLGAPSNSIYPCKYHLKTLIQLPPSS